ncbi:MAG: TolC family protein [Gammaproteobacteria bacterium]
MPAVLRLGSFALVFFIGLGPSSAAEKIELEQAINYALTQNRQLALSALSTESTALGITRANLQFEPSYRPEVSLGTTDGESSASYGMRVSKKLNSGTELSTRVTRWRDDAQAGAEDYRTSVEVEIAKPIFRNAGALIHEEPLMQAANDLATARRRYELQRVDLVINVVEKYEEILRLSRQFRADEQALKRTAALYRVTRAREAVGRTKRVDTLRVEFQHGQTLSRLSVNREILANARQDFAELLGFAPVTVFDLTPTVLLEYNNLQPDEAIRTALENRLDYAQTLQDYQDAARGVRIARRRLLPGMKLFARYHRNVDNTLSPSTIADSSDGIWFFGISADTDFNRTRENTVLRSANIDKTAVLQDIKALELSIDLQVRQHIRAYDRARTEIEIAEKNLTLAAARLKFARRLFDLGRGDNFSVTDAEDALFQAKTQLFSTRAQVSIKSYQLSRALGTLIAAPSDLKPLTL